MSLGPSGAFGLPHVKNDVPTGAVFPFAGQKAPKGYLLCDGSSYSQGAYPDLWGIIGTAYGGSGGTFLVPNMRDNVPIGAGNSYTLASTGGEATHVLTTPEMPSHTHTQNSHQHTFNAYEGTGSGATTTGGSDFGPVAAVTTGQTAVNQNTGGGGAHNNVQPYVALNYIIKT